MTSDDRELFTVFGYFKPEKSNNPICLFYTNGIYYAFVSKNTERENETTY